MRPHGRTHLLTPLSKALLEKLTGCHLVKKYPAFYGTLSFVTMFTTAHHLSLCWARKSSPCPSNPLPEDPFHYYPPIYAWVFHVVSFLQVSPPNPCMHLTSPPAMLHAPPISFSLIWSSKKYLARSTDH